MPEMKCHREVKGREALYKKLEAKIQEEKHWIPSKRRFLSMGNGEVSFLERDHAVRGILNLTKMFKMFPETYAMAVNFMDRFLARLKVRPVHLHCVSITCVFIAVKLQEEQQYIPDLDGLMSSSVKTELRAPCYNPTDCLRMERKVLDKLEWDLNPVTPLTLLELYFLAAVLEGCLSPDENPNDELSLLTEQLEIALTYSSIAVQTSSIIALSLITVRLSDCQVWSEKLLPLFMDKSKSSHEDFYNCEELVEELLYSMNSFDMESNLNALPVMYRRDHSVTFAPMSLSQSDLSASDNDTCTPPSKKPTYASVLTRSLNDSMMSMSM